MPPVTRRTVSKDFEEKTTATLQAQDRTLEEQNRVLERVDKRLNAPVLNGGFEDLIKKVDKVENVTAQLSEKYGNTSQKIADIHTAVYDPEKGIYVTVKSHDKWITAVGTAGRWFGALLVTGMLTGMGKLLYDFITGHLHYTP